MGRPYFNPRGFHIGNRISSNLILSKIFIITWISWVLCSPWKQVYSGLCITKENIHNQGCSNITILFWKRDKILWGDQAKQYPQKICLGKKYFSNIHPWPSSKFFPIKKCSVCLPEQPDFQLLHQEQGSGDLGAILRRHSTSPSLNENPQGTREVPTCQSLSRCLPIPLPSQFFSLIILYRCVQVTFHSLLSLLLIQRGRKEQSPRTHSPYIFYVSSPFVPQQRIKRYIDSHLTDEDPKILTH